MATLWGMALGAPVAAAGVLCAASPDAAKRVAKRFASSRPAAAVLSAIAWLWTAYECDIIGIDVFDMFLKRFPGELLLLAAVLCWLTIIWMPKNLPVRALCGIFMLIPAQLFPVTRRLLPESGASAVHVLVVAGYAFAIAGMFGMFYPWRIEKAGAVLLSHRAAARAAGIAAIAAGAAISAAGVAA